MAKFSLVMLFALMLAGSAVLAERQSLKRKVSGRTGRFPCMGSASYMVSVTFAWSSMTHPFAYPPGGFFSPHVVASHGDYYTMWARLGFASKGVQDVAETGDPTQLMEELADQKSRNVMTFRVEDGPSSGTATVNARVRVSGGRSYITTMSMLAPSPDWYTGIPRVNMCNRRTGEYLRVRRGNLGVYDAGTDTGRSFNSPDMPADPADRRPILSILAGRFRGIPVGTYRITRID